MNRDWDPENKQRKGINDSKEKNKIYDTKGEWKRYDSVIVDQLK